MSNEAPILTIPNVNDVACLNRFVALIEYIEHEYAWLKKLASNVIGEEQESICYESVCSLWSGPNWKNRTLWPKFQ
jgi:hypothetical protein